MEAGATGSGRESSPFSTENLRRIQTVMVAVPSVEIH